MGSYTAADKDPSEHPQKPKKPPSRKNPWGNRSYADLITQAIQNAPEKRLTLSQIYEWMVKNIPHFKDKGENNSSAGWKNSIRHNLSLHTRFVRIQNEGTGKSSWWVIDPTAGEGRATRRRSSNKGDRVRPFRRHRPKPKTEQQSNKGLVAFHTSPFVNNFRHQISNSGTYHDNKYYDGITVPNYVPFTSALHLTDNQRQRWHSSSSCSSEEFGYNEIRPHKRFSLEFLQPSPPYSDRSASEISSLSLEHDTEDRVDFVPDQQQTYRNSHYEKNSWYKMPSPYCSSEHIDGITHVSGGNFWNDPNEIVQNSASFITKARILNEVYDKDSPQCVQQVNAFLNVKNCDRNPEDMVSEEQSRYSYEYLNDRTGSHDPDYLRDMDMPPLTVIEYSSQHPSDDDSIYYSARGNSHVCGKMADTSSTYLHDSSSEKSDDSNCDYFYVHKYVSSELTTNEETPLIPPDLHFCEVSTGLDCDITEVFQLEMAVEGSLEFLESFGTLCEV